MLANTESTYTQQFLTQMSSSLSNASFEVITPTAVPLESRAVIQHTFTNTKTFLARIPKVRGFHRLERIRQFISRSDNYDICQIHIVNPQYWYLRGVLQKKCRNVVSSIWEVISTGSPVFLDDDRKHSSGFPVRSLSQTEIL